MNRNEFDDKTADRIFVDISPEIANAAPDLKVIVIEAVVNNAPSSTAVLELLETLSDFVSERFTAISDINKRPGILGTREAYKTCGKDPNRYRPSQEQLSRRVFTGKSLYTVSNVVDVLNYLSVLSGYSIGAFDRDCIEGDRIVLGIGQHEEPYEGIGRGNINIEGMPVYRDKAGGIGTPTSDNERTKMSPTTHRLLVCINVYREDMPITETMSRAEQLLTSYCNATDIHSRVVSAGITDH